MCVCAPETGQDSSCVEVMASHVVRVHLIVATTINAVFDIKLHHDARPSSIIKVIIIVIETSVALIVVVIVVVVFLTKSHSLNVVVVPLPEFRPHPLHHLTQQIHLMDCGDVVQNEQLARLSIARHCEAVRLVRL